MGECRRKEDYLMRTQDISRDAAKDIRVTQGKVRRLHDASRRVRNSALGVFNTAASFLATRSALASAIAASRALTPPTARKRRGRSRKRG